MAEAQRHGPSLSVVIPTYNRPRQLERLLASIAAADRVPGGIEVIIVDDGSTEPEAEHIARCSELDCRCVRQSRAGPASARNHGWREARSDRLVFVDDDCVVGPAALVALYHALDSADAVGATLRPLTASGLIAGYMHAEGLVDHKVVDGQVRWLVTACAGFRRTVLEACHGFDEGFTHGGEDADLTFRLTAAGYRAVIEPEAFVFHEHRTGIGQLVRTYYRHGTAQRLLLRKHRFRQRDLARSSVQRLDPMVWLRTYRRYRLKASRSRSVAFVVLRWTMMVPWIVGALRGASKGVEG